MNLQIGKNIKSLRQNRGITQETLANHIGVAPQSISKWERSEGYPDITFLIPLAEYFGVTLDELMGMDAEKTEKYIAAQIKEIERLRHIGAHEEKNEIIRKLYAEHPHDFRVIVHYIDLLLDESPVNNREEVENLCSYMLDECSVDSLRYEAITSAIRLYSETDEYDKANEYADRLPKLWMSQEFSRTQIYPAGDKRDDQAAMTFIDLAIERVLLVIHCQACDRKDISTEEQIDLLERMWKIADIIFPDFDCDVCHSGLAENGFALFRRYTMMGEHDKALAALERAFRHEKAIDEIGNEVITHTSPILRGAVYDMRETWDGCKCNGVQFMLDLVNNEELAKEYADDPRFNEILDTYRSFAVEDKTK